MGTAALERENRILRRSDRARSEAVKRLRAQIVHAGAVPTDGVTQTALSALYHRALESERPSSPLDDPTAVEFIRATGIKAAKRGARAHAWRTLCMDRTIAAWIDSQPHGTVVSLGCGLDSRRQRIGDVGQWVNVDSAAVLRVREYVLADEPDRFFCGSALEPDWMDVVPPGPVLVEAQGLMCHLSPEDARSLIDSVLDRFGHMIVDANPAWMQNDGWAITPDELDRLRGRYGVRLLESPATGLLHGTLVAMLARRLLMPVVLDIQRQERRWL